MLGRRARVNLECYFSPHRNCTRNPRVCGSGESGVPGTRSTERGAFSTRSTPALSRSLSLALALHAARACVCSFPLSPFAALTNPPSGFASIEQENGAIPQRHSRRTHVGPTAPLLQPALICSVPIVPLPTAPFAKSAAYAIVSVLAAAVPPAKASFSCPFHVARNEITCGSARFETAVHHFKSGEAGERVAIDTFSSLPPIGTAQKRDWKKSRRLYEEGFRTLIFPFFSAFFLRVPRDSSQRASPL